MHTEPEQHIVDLAIRGDHQAFRHIVELYQQKALSLALRMVKDQPLAEDVVQDAFVRMYRSIARFRGDSQFSTWVYRIVYTTCLNALRSQRRLPVIDPLDEETTPSWIEPEFFDQIDHDLIENVLHDELQKMGPNYSAVMDLFYVKECSYDEIVRVTGMPLGTVKTRLNRGRALLREALLTRLPELRRSVEGVQ